MIRVTLKCDSYGPSGMFGKGDTFTAQDNPASYRAEVNGRQEKIYRFIREGSETQDGIEWKLPASAVKIEPVK